MSSPYGIMIVNNVIQLKVSILVQFIIAQVIQVMRKLNGLIQIVELVFAYMKMGKKNVKNMVNKTFFVNGNVLVILI